MQWKETTKENNNNEMNRIWNGKTRKVKLKSKRNNNNLPQTEVCMRVMQVLNALLHIKFNSNLFSVTSTAYDH